MATSSHPLLSVTSIPLPSLRGKRHPQQRRATLPSLLPDLQDSLRDTSNIALSIQSNQPSPPNTPVPGPSTAVQPIESHDWETIYTPLGTHYYYYHGGYKVVTDNNPDEKLREDIKHATEGVILPSKCEWHRRKDGNVFYINHEKETAIHIVGRWEPPPEDDDEKLDARKSKYWEFVRKHAFHLRHFKHTLSKDAKAEALNALSLILAMHALGPRQPIAPFSKSQCQEMREILTTDPPFQEGERRFSKFEHRAYVIAAILEQIYAQRFWCKAQPKGDFPTAPNTKKPSWLSIMVKFITYSLLLGLPFHHQMQIEKIKKVRIGKEEIPQHCRREIIEKTKTEHQISLVVAALLLAASLATKAIPGIDSYTLLFATVAAQCGYASVLINIVALWQYVGTLEDDVTSGRHYFKRHVPVIACLQSLPFATLLWGLLSLGIAGSNFPFRASRRAELQGDETEPLLKPGQRIFASITITLLGLAVVVAISDVARTKYLAIKSEKAGIQETEVQNLGSASISTPAPITAQGALSGAHHLQRGSMVANHVV